MPLSEERKGQLALAAHKIQLRKSFALKDIANINRNVGNLKKEPEMRVINASSEEILEFIKNLLEEILAEQIPDKPYMI